MHNIELVSMENYKTILNENAHLFNKLNEICIAIGEPVEGNCFTEHLNIHNTISELIYKQMNHYTLGKISNNIMEIGFNAGHSCLLYLLSNPSSKLTIFDLCEHKYTMPCFEYLNSIFPNRMRIFPGDSTITIPTFINNNPNEKFDLIHVDGCHLSEIAIKDFDNALLLASNIIIFDDTQLQHLNDIFEKYLVAHNLKEVNLYKTQIYEHRICLK